MGTIYWLGLVALVIGGTVGFRLGTLAICFVQLLWPYVFAVRLQNRLASNKPLWGLHVSITATSLILIALLFSDPGSNDPLGFGAEDNLLLLWGLGLVWNICCFTILWSAASSLTRAEVFLLDKQRSTFVAFICMVYAMVGVFSIMRRLAALADHDFDIHWGDKTPRILEGV